MSNPKTITMSDILAVFKNARDEKRLREIKAAVVASQYPDMLLVEPEIASGIEKQIDELIKADKRKDTQSNLIYKQNGKYKKRSAKRAPATPDAIDEEKIDTTYFGRAGECAVMSELLYRGYNANRMMIDDGVDIIAAKDNIYYYIQVKTTAIKSNGRIYCKIDLGSFDRYSNINNMMRYIIVARYKEHGVDRNMFFTFTSQEIERAVYDRCISQGENGFNIKIKFNELDNAPILYDDKEMNISWNLNRFNL